MSDEKSNLLKRLSDAEERIEQLEQNAASMGEVLEQLVEQLLEVRSVLSEPPPSAFFPF